MADTSIEKFRLKAPRIELHLSSIDSNWQNDVTLDHVNRTATFRAGHNNNSVIKLANVCMQLGYHVTSVISPVSYVRITLYEFERFTHELYVEVDPPSDEYPRMSETVDKTVGMKVIQTIIAERRGVVRLHLNAPVTKQIVGFIVSCLRYGADAFILITTHTDDLRFAHKRFFLNPTFPLSFKSPRLTLR